MNLAKIGRSLLIIISIALLSSSVRAEDEGPIKIGILHSQSGTMAISEAPLKDLLLMLIEEQNAAGGVLGRRLQPVIMDPASNDSLFAQMAQERHPVPEGSLRGSIEELYTRPALKVLARHEELDPQLRPGGSKGSLWKAGYHATRALLDGAEILRPLSAAPGPGSLGG